MKKIYLFILQGGLLFSLLFFPMAKVHGNTYLQAWQQAVNHSKEYNNYQVNMNFRDNEANESFNFMSQTNSNDNIVEMIMEYKDDQDNMTEIHLVTKAPYNQAYINLVDLLIQIGDSSIREALSAYKNYYTILPIKIKPTYLDQAPLKESLIFLPNLHYLKVNQGDISNIHNFWYQTLSANEIHPDLYFQQGNFLLDFELNLSSSFSRNINIEQELSLDFAANNLAFNINIRPEAVYGAKDIYLAFDLKSINNRLIKTSLYLDQEQPYYGMSLIGLKDLVNWNVNNNETAEYYTGLQEFFYEYRGLPYLKNDLSDLRTIDLNRIEDLINQ